MKNKLKILFLLFLILAITVACGELDSKKVNEAYVKKQFEKQLNYKFSPVMYDLEITSFDQDSEKRQANGTVKLKDRFNTICTIHGEIGDDYFSASHIGTSYHVSTGCDDIILENAKKDLEDKYVLELNSTTDYEELSKSIKLYIEELRDLLNDYKESFEFKNYFSDVSSFVEITVVRENDVKKYIIYIDNYNGLVITNTSAGFFGWRGELELKDYLELLYNGTLDKKSEEIDYNNYGYEVS